MITCSEYGLVGSGPEHRSLILQRLGPYAGTRLEPSPSFLSQASSASWTVVRAWPAGSMLREEEGQLRALVLCRQLHLRRALGRGRQLLVHCLDPYLPLHVRGQRRAVKGTPHALRHHA